MKTTVNDNTGVYYQNLYWNDVKEVYEYMCHNFTGDKTIWWVEDFKKRFGEKPFKRGLFINCGNGRMEREFIDKGIVISIDAFDYSEILLQEAKNKREKRNIAYFQADANQIKLPKTMYDLIVNVAGLHHVQFINRFIYALGKSMTKDGIFVNFDYIGPHRNQYPKKQWRLVKKINDNLSPSLRHDKLLYPSVPVMLEEDPTEAIHSELIIETVKRYFTVTEKHDTGGGIAYPLLTHNVKIRNKGIRKEVLKIIDYDRTYTRNHTVPVLFSYFIAKPNAILLTDKKQYDRFQVLENRREKWSQIFGGVYRIQDFFHLLLHTVKKTLKNLM